MALRIIFMGTPEFSVPTLAELVAAGHDVVAVYTQPPRAAGRGKQDRKSAVHRHAESAGLPVRTPVSLRAPEEIEAFAATVADVAVVVAYGLILPRPVLAAPRLGCLNLHASALPRWRGAAPIHRAVMAGDRETAVMVMRMEAGLDTGPICLAERVAIGPSTTTGQLHDDLKLRGAGLMVRALVALERGSLTETPQSAEGITYAAKIEKSEARIDFRQPAVAVHNHVRGLSPSPGAWCEVEAEGSRERIKVLASELVTDGAALHCAGAASAPAPGKVIAEPLTIACADGAVRFLELQRAGRKPMSASELLRGFPIPIGTRLLSE